MLTEKTLTVNRGLEQKTNKKNRIFIKELWNSTKDYNLRLMNKRKEIFCLESALMHKRLNKYSEILESFQTTTDFNTHSACPSRNICSKKQSIK